MVSVSQVEVLKWFVGKWNEAYRKELEIVKSGGIEEKKAEWREYFTSRFGTIE